MNIANVYFSLKLDFRKDLRKPELKIFIKSIKLSAICFWSVLSKIFFVALPF